MTKIGLVKTAKGVNLRVAVDNGALMVKVSRSVGRSCSMAYYERHMPSKTWCRQRAQLINRAQKLTISISHVSLH